MGYYRGDGGNYYRGDYYRGDPWLGVALSGIGKLAKSKVGRWVGRQVVGRQGRRNLDRTLDVAAGYGIARGFGPQAPGMPGGALPQYDDDQQPGTGPMTKRDPTREERRLKGRRPPKFYRKMNPLNPKALSRALRRAQGFEKFAKKTVNALYKTVDGRRVKTFKKK